MSLAGQKHPRDEVEQSEEAMLCLYELYLGDLSEQMLSFASIHDLCTFDALSKQFQARAESRWKELVYKETGMKNGKIDWIRYLSFLRKSISVELVDEADHGYGCGFAGTPHVSTNGSLVVMVTDDTSDNAYDRTYPSNENEEICVRDAYSLNFSRLVSSPIYSWKSALCGRVGSEIIVTSNNREVAAIRGNDTQIVRRHRELVAPNGISLLGCDTHLIVCIGNCLKLYRVETDTASAELLSLKQSITMRESAQEIITGSVDDEISWGSDKSSFVYCRHGTEKISVWSLDVPSDTINQVKLIDYGENEDLQIENVALGDDYIVGASTQRDIHVWNRFTGEKLPHVLCDIKEEDDRLGPDDIVRSLLLWCYGHILVSSSHLGNKLCIWDVKSGELLEEHVLELDELPDGSDPSSLAYLSHLNGFLLVTSYFSNFIAFPMNKRQEEMAKSIKRREQRIKRVLLFGIGEEFYPNNCSDSDDS